MKKHSDEDKLDAPPAPLPPPQEPFKIVKVNMNCFKLYLFNSFLGAHHSEASAKNRAKLLIEHIDRLRYARYRQHPPALLNRDTTESEKREIAETTCPEGCKDYTNVTYRGGYDFKCNGCGLQWQYWGWVDEKETAAALAGETRQEADDFGLHLSDDILLECIDPKGDHYFNADKCAKLISAKFAALLKRAETAEAALTQAQTERDEAVVENDNFRQLLREGKFPNWRDRAFALMEAIEPLASASKFMVDTITDDESLGGWGITAGHSRKAHRVYEQVKEKI